MNKILKIWISLLLLSCVAYANKEVIVLIDTSTKLNKKTTQKGLIKIFNFNKKKKKKNYLKYEDSVSLYYMSSDAEDIQPKYFDGFEIEQSKKSRKALKKKAKKSLASIKKLSGKDIGKVIKVPSTDIVFCMDNSGSMYGNNGSNYKIAKEIAYNLIDSIKSKKTKISLVSFDDTAHLNQAFTSSKKKLKKAFKKIKPGHNTNVTAGLKRSCSLLANSSADIKKIIFLSDGLPTVGTTQSAIKQAQTCHKDNIEIITLALPGSQVSFLNQLSSMNITLDVSNVDLNSIMSSLQGLPSPIIESLYYMSNQFDPEYQERTLIIFSSMMQKSEKYNFYIQHDLRSKETINNLIKSIKASGQLPDLSNTKVYIQGLSKAIGSEKNSELEAFWKAYFIACGASVKSWSPNALNLKK